MTFWVLEMPNLLEEYARMGGGLGQPRVGWWGRGWWRAARGAGPTSWKEIKRDKLFNEFGNRASFEIGRSDRRTAAAGAKSRSLRCQLTT